MEGFKAWDFGGDEHVRNLIIFVFLKDESDFSGQKKCK